MTRQFLLVMIGCSIIVHMTHGPIHNTAPDFFRYMRIVRMGDYLYLAHLNIKQYFLFLHTPYVMRK